MNKFINLINQTRQSLSDLEQKKTNSIENLIELETTLQDIARAAHDEAFLIATDKSRKRALERDIASSRCQSKGAFHGENCPKRIN